ncbi:MAG: hypothetical protein JXQ29_11090 [Planctomycetes bacterium]|nr:hypothetical protein [Planctomycetota bacterium]
MSMRPDHAMQRAAFGQPRQEELLRLLRVRTASGSAAAGGAAADELGRYCIDLAPAPPASGVPLR